MSTWKAVYLFTNFHDTWLDSIKNIIDSSGFSHIWANQKQLHQLDPRAISQVVNSIMKSLECQFLQNANSEVKEQTKLHLFSNITPSLRPAPYLSKIVNRNQRSLFSKLRLGTLKLEIETGRYEKTKIDSNKRFCKLCNSNKIGNECHFIFECPALEAYRKPLVDFISNTHRCFAYWSPIEKTKFLFFNNESDIPTLLSSCSLLRDLFEKRKSILDSPQPQVCWSLVICILFVFLSDICCVYGCCLFPFVLLMQCVV